MKSYEDAQHTSWFIVEAFGAPGFMWEIVTWERRTSAVVGTKRSVIRYKTKAEAREAGEAALKIFVLPPR